MVYANDEASARRALEQGRDADVIVKASGVGVFDSLLEAGVLEIRRPGRDRDLLGRGRSRHPCRRCATIPAIPLRPLIASFDYVLTYGGGDPVIDAYKAIGARDCVPIYNALDPETHHPVASDTRFEADLSFMANRLPDREARVEQFFLDAAARLPQRRFLLGGSGWGDKPMPSNVDYVGHVYTARPQRGSTARRSPCSMSPATAWPPSAFPRPRGCSRRPGPAPA